MKEKSRPVITINRIRSVINLLSGYAVQNETELDFLHRSEEDDRVARGRPKVLRSTLLTRQIIRVSRKKHSKTLSSVASEIIGLVMNLIMPEWMEGSR